MEAKVERAHLFVKVRYSESEERDDEHARGRTSLVSVYSEKTLVRRRTGSAVRCLEKETATAPERIDGTFLDAQWRTTKTVTIVSPERIEITDAVGR